MAHLTELIQQADMVCGKGMWPIGASMLVVSGHGAGGSGGTVQLQAVLSGVQGGEAEQGWCVMMLLAARSRACCRRHRGGAVRQGRATLFITALTRHVGVA